MLQHKDKGEPFDVYAIRQSGAPARLAPDNGGAPELAGGSKIELVGSSGEKAEELFRDAVAQVGATCCRHNQEVLAADLSRYWNLNDISTRHCRSAPS
jgi:hypothetical protein